MAYGVEALVEGMFDSKEEEEELRKSIYNRQDEAERRKIREGYRNFMDALNENKEQLIDPSNKDDLLTQKLSKVDSMFKKVKMTREGALDSASLVRLADLSKMKAQALKTDFITFNAADFCDKVRMTVAGDADGAAGELSPQQWIHLGHAVQPFFHRTPVLTFMCGSFERGEVCLRRSRPKEKEKEKEKESAKQSTKPIQLSSLDETDRGEPTTAQVDHLLNTLWSIYEDQGGNPICFFEFVTNPHSFGQTVENIFYASFLVRDGHAQIMLDEDQLPVIVPIQKDEMEKGKDRVQKHQVVISITQDEWKSIVNTFEIEEALIKPIDVLKDRQNIQESSQTPRQGKGKGKKSVVIS